MVAALPDHITACPLDQPPCWEPLVAIAIEGTPASRMPAVLSATPFHNTAEESGLAAGEGSSGSAIGADVPKSVLASPTTSSPLMARARAQQLFNPAPGGKPGINADCPWPVRVEKDSPPVSFVIV